MHRLVMTSASSGWLVPAMTTSKRDAIIDAGMRMVRTGEDFDTVAGEHGAILCGLVSARIHKRIKIQSKEKLQMRRECMGEEYFIGGERRWGPAESTAAAAAGTHLPLAVIFRRYAAEVSDIPRDSWGLYAVAEFGRSFSCRG